MIVYSPINGEVLTNAFKFYPRTAFVMTKLGMPISEELAAMRDALKLQLAKCQFNEIDASSSVTGKDFLDKIWKVILGVPLGIAVLTKDIKPRTLANIYYELGIMDALGKETIIVKSPNYDIPSDFKRTEYINFDKSFSKQFLKFIDNLKEREDHYWLMSEIIQADPVLSIDYIKRAYLLNPLKKYKKEANKIFIENDLNIDEQSKLHIKNFLNSR